MGSICGSTDTDSEPLVQNNNEEKKQSSSSNNKKSSEKSSIRTRYHFQKTLGKGASCRVVEAINKQTQEHVAIKIMSKEKSVTSTLYKYEINILSKLKHENIINLISNEEDDQNYYVITTMCRGGELFDRIVSPDYRITEKIAAKLVHDMLKALQHCHEKNIVHRDLKPENFVFESKDDNANVVLIDFGCAKEVDDETVYKDLVGTVYYLAPELAAMSSRVPTTGKVLKCADLWSLGVITYVMLTGRPPFKGRSNREIFTRIIKDPLKFPNDIKISDGFKEFVSLLLQKNPYKRISISEALNHPWVKGTTAADYQLNKDVIKYLKQFSYQSKLKKAITRVLAANMSKEPEDEVRRHFERLDTDGDGHLDESEIETLLLDMGYAPSIAKKEATNMLEAADLNKDGTVDFGEFKAVWHRKLLSQHEQYIHRVFAVFDDNGDGQIDATELAGVLGDEMPSILEMIKEVDTDNNGTISFKEFKLAMLEDTKKCDQLTEAGIGQGGYKEEDRIKGDFIDEKSEDDQKENENENNE